MSVKGPRKFLRAPFNKREAASQDLILSAFMCDERGVRLALDDGANTNIKDISGLTPLLLVVSHNDRKKYRGLLSCLNMLLEHGADLNSSDRKGRTACHIICSNDKIGRGDRFAALRMLVNFDYPDDKLTRFSNKEGSEAKLSQTQPEKDCWESALVSVGHHRKNSEPNARPSHIAKGELLSPLTIDVKDDSDEDQSVRPVLYLGHSVQNFPKNASIFDVSRDLSRAQSDQKRNVRQRWRRKTHNDRWRSNSDMGDIKQENLNQRCNINRPDSGWRTPLLDAARHGFSEGINFLIENKANVNASTRTGETPLHGAIWGLHIDCIDALLSAGCDMNAQDNEGNTFLHLLAINAKNRIETAFIDRTLQVIHRVKLDCEMQKKRKTGIMTAIRESIETLGIEVDMKVIALITDFVYYEGANLRTKNNLNISAYGIAARLANKNQCSLQIAKALRPRP